MEYVAVIPARYGSTRLPAKPLRDICGKPMIQHTYERVVETGLFSDILVATDSAEICSCVEAFGGKAVMTSPQHRTGTERVAEVASTCRAEIIVNIQGDEPLLDVQGVRELLGRFSREKVAVVGTLKYPLRSASDFSNPNVVKVVTDLMDYALYFSRSPIPYAKDWSASSRIDPGDLVCYKHVGIYAFTRDFLLAYPRLPKTRLEQSEKLEQLRVLEHGYRILVPTTTEDSIGVDTEEDLDRVREICRQQKVCEPACE